MINRLSMIALALLASGVHAAPNVSPNAAPRNIQFPEELIQYVDNARVVAFVNRDELAAEAAWSPLETRPPLGLSDALSAVKSHIEAEPRLAGAALDSIELQRIPHHANHWNYTAKLTTTDRGRRVAHYLLVLMNGHVLAALGEPDSIK